MRVESPFRPFHPFHLSLETVIAASPLLGHPLENRARIREAQDETLIEEWQAASSIPLRDADQRNLFCVAPLDILVTEEDGDKRFHMIELNGTGIGGLTNMSEAAVEAVLDGFREMGRSHWCSDALILVASSGKESDDAPRLNRLIYEKLLYAEALKQGIAARGRAAQIFALPQLMAGRPLAAGPAIVVGYIKDFLNHLRLERGGELSLFGRPVTGLVNDRFTLNIVNQFGRRVDLDHCQTMNRCFLAGGDKGVAYGLLNEYLREHPSRSFPDQVAYARAHHREALVSTVLKWIRWGRQVVIKPHGTGVGHGIEFFLAHHQSEDDVIRRIDGSILTTERYYAIPGGAFPYTVCEYLDTCTIDRAGHPLSGHKYELRIVVYRDGLTLKAFPSIVKVSSRAWDPARPERDSLINNVTSSSETTKTAGTEHMLPLANRGTLDLLGLESDEVAEACAVCTGYVRHVVTRVQQQPERFWLAPPQADVRPRLRVAA